MRSVRFAVVSALVFSVLVTDFPGLGRVVSAAGTTSRAALGYEHAVALGSDGTVWTWGALVPGPSGPGSKDSLKQPTRVTVDARTFVDVAATNYSSAAVANDGSVWAWGTLGLGLGDAATTTARRYTDPVQVEFPAGTSITRISGACESFLALDSSGGVWQWGSFYGLWDQSYSMPTRVSGISSAVSVHRGCSSSFVVMNDGTARAWGSNGGGRLGDGTTTDRSTPVTISLPGSRSFSTISASWSHTLATATDGTLWGWGGNSQGNLAADPTAIEYTSTPRQITISGASGSIVSVLATGSTPTSVAVTSTGQVWEWGTWGNTSFVPTRRNLPSDMGSSKIVAAVASSWNATLYPASDGAIWGKGGWGSVDLDGNCGATASDYPTWRNGATIPARPLVRVRSTGQFGPAFAEDELSIARLETGTGASLPLDGSGTAVGQVGAELSVVATAPRSSCFDVADLTYEVSKDGGVTFTDQGVATSTNGFGQVVVTVRFTPTTSGRIRGFFRLKNPDGAISTYRFWLGIAAAVSGQVPDASSSLPMIAVTDRRDAAVGIGTDGYLYGWGAEVAVTGQTADAPVQDKMNPRRLNTPAGLTFVDIAVAGTVAAAVAADGRLFVWGKTPASEQILASAGVLDAPTTTSTTLVVATSSSIDSTTTTVTPDESSTTTIDPSESSTSTTSSTVAPSTTSTPITSTTLPTGTGSSSWVTITEPKELVLPARKAAARVELMQTWMSTGSVLGVVVTTDGSVLVWGGSAASSMSRGSKPSEVPTLVGINFRDVASSSGLFYLRAGDGWYAWNAIRLWSCSGSCSYTEVPTVFYSSNPKSNFAPMGSAPFNYSTRRIEITDDGQLVKVDADGTEKQFPLPGGRLARELSGMTVVATDGTVWTLREGWGSFPDSWNRRPYPVAISRFAGLQGIYLVDADGYVMPLGDTAGAIAGTCAALRDDQIGRDWTRRRVTSTGQFGPVWQEDEFALNLDSNSTPASWERWRVDWEWQYESQDITVRPTSETRIVAYFKAACGSPSSLSAAWDLDDDGEFETSAGVTAVQSGDTYLSTPRRPEGDDSGYEGFDATWRQAAVTLDAQAAGGILESGRGRFVSVRLSSPFGSKTKRFPVVARPAKPAGRIGISINSSARFASSSDVNLSLVWPEGTTSAIIANDGSFSDAQEVPVAEQVRWRLPAEGSGLMPTTVYVRFKSLSSDGQGGWSPWGESETNYTDDIVLDLSPPAVSSLTASTVASLNTLSQGTASTVTRKVIVNLDAEDAASGIQAMQVTTDPAIPGREMPFSRRITFNADRGTIAVRVKDNVGQWSPWKFTRITGFTPPPAGSPSNDISEPTPAPELPRPEVPSGASEGNRREEKKEDEASTPAPSKPVDEPTARDAEAPRVVIAKPQRFMALPESKVAFSSPTLLAGSAVSTSAKSVSPSSLRASTSSSAAKTVAIPTGVAVRATVQGLPALQKVGLSIKIGGKQVSLGSVTATSKGRISVPALQFRKPGTFLVSMTTTVGGKTRTNFVKFVVKRG